MGAAGIAQGQALLKKGDDEVAAPAQPVEEEAKATPEAAPAVGGPEQEQAQAAPVAQGGAVTASGKALTTSVKVHAPPGGKSSITF